ncbi:MAG: radical SAM family heme chaperone HemW [Pseudomonadota bacterium]|nr:radical SAM family heme chaperone HemW [Pseudomonadota bacterium]
MTRPANNPPADNPLALYIHWPFCRAKCPYCDFNSHVAQEIDHARFAAAYRREMAHMAAHYGAGRKLVSVFFGGGTPSLMPPSLVAAILGDAERYFGFSDDVEITAEANPTSSEAAMFAGFRAAGVNRISLGVQSLRNAGLDFLGREHSVADARRAISMAQRSFTRASIDLIYARHDQRPADWEAELREALDLGLTHMSLYQLTIEPGTVFHTRSRRGARLIPADDLAAEMYEATNNIMAATGLPAYEISNHAAGGEMCRHNLVYWRAQDWIGIGPGAHGRLTMPGGRLGLATRRSPAAWLDSVEADGHAIDIVTRDDQAESIAECLMMGLRLAEGVSLPAMERRFGPRGVWLDEAALCACLSSGMLDISGGNLRATPAGRLLLDGILAGILPD